MNRLTLLISAAALAVVAVTGPHATVSGQQRSADNNLVSLTFRGGSAADYIETIRIGAERVNILVDPGLQEVPMPAIELASVSVATALELLEGRTHEGPTGLFRVDVRSVRNDPQETPTYHIRSQALGDQRSTGAGVFSISAIVDKGISAEDVIDAVKLAVEVTATPSRADIRYHKATGLVIARGDHRQLAAIADVIERLEAAVEDRDAGGDQRQTQTAITDVERLAQRIDQLEQLLRERERELTETRRQLQDTEILLEAARQRRGGT